MKKYIKTTWLLLLIVQLLVNDVYAQKQPVTLLEQGSFTVGGSVKTSPGTFDPVAHGAFNPSNQATEGQTLHGDHATIFYQIPDNANKLPLVFWHGYGQSMRTWQTTPDGREGFQTLFLRRNFPIFLIDQPRRGLSGRSTKPTTISAATDDQLWFGIFRLGTGSTFYPDVQFSDDPEALNQFFRQITPDTGPLNINLNIEAVSTLFDKIGPGVLVTHSHSGGQGWLTALKNGNIKGIASYEPGSNFVFPEGEVPETIPYVDYIPNEPVAHPGQEQWRAALQMAKLWTATVNKHGGDVTLVHLPEKGLKGNTHFPMSDLNNEKVAVLLAEWLKEKGLDKK